MEKINILYIDDGPDSDLEKYLYAYSHPEYEIGYSEIIFDTADGYNSLIQSNKVRAANIIFIDSRLFENHNAGKNKFSGEELKIILKKFFPFIEVIVITQNDPDSTVGTLAKFNSRCTGTAAEYYANHLPPIINAAINNISVYRRLANQLKSNGNWEATLKDKIINSLQGISTYDELTKSDIDQLISAFKEIQVILDAE